jgi:hypothetical protein
LLELAGGRPMLAMYLAQALNVVLGAATCLLVAHLAARSVDASAASPASGHWWDALRRPPLAAGLAWALYPPALGHTARAHTPVLEGFLLLLLAVLMLEAIWSDRAGALRWSAGAGVVLGLLLLVRPSYGLVWAAWGAILLWRIRGGPQAWQVVLVSGLLAALVLAPWTVRNYRLHGALVPVATNGGFNFYIGNNPQVEGDIPALDDFFASFPPEGADYWRAMTEVERDRELYRQGLVYWREHPGDAVRGALNRLTAYTFFRPYLFVAYPRWLAALFVASYLAILLPFLAALPRSRGPVTLFSVAAIVVTGLVGLAYVVSMRFRASVEPFFVVVAARLVRR